MDEGFADIWGACVEEYAVSQLGLVNKSIWLHGEEVARNGIAIRSMSNPKMFNQPNTYQGVNWVNTVTNPDASNDYGGVHTNSGLLAYWFFLLSQGGAGTNDNGTSYSLEGIGITKAARIAYLTERLLSPTADFAAAHDKSLQAAATLYGVNSAQYLAVVNAWHAVGIGSGIAYGSASTSFIDAVALEQLARFSNSDNGYYDGVTTNNTPAQLNRCSTYSLLHSAGFSTGNPVSNTYWNVYIDLNQDQDFSDPGERVVSNKLVTNAAWTLTPFNITSSSSLPGTTRMRVTMSNAPNDITCGSIGAGEVEDYTINLSSSTNVGAVSNVVVTNVTNSTASLKWNKVNNVSGYLIKFRIVGSVVWSNTNSTTNYIKLLNLPPGNTFECQVTASNACGALGNSSSLVFFTTPFNRSTGNPPSSRSNFAVTIDASPNPATDIIHLRIAPNTDGTTPVITDVVVYDLRGARVTQVRYEGNGNLHLGSLAPGLYNATVFGGATPARVRFVKQ